MRKFYIIILLLIVSLLFSSYMAKPFRLHVVANSNSTEDQKVKLAVRDAILEATQEDLQKCSNQFEAAAYMREHLKEIETIATEVLAEWGFDYVARASIGTFDFPDKTYGSVTYPAGYYAALRLELGSGVGDNWWCVMFPPLCVVNTDAEPEEEVVYTSLIAEWFGKLFGTN